MAKVKNTMKLVEQYDKHANANYDIFAENINDICRNSENQFEMVLCGFKFGYMQGLKATKAEIREKQNYEDIIDDNIVDLEKAHMAIRTLLDEYDWNYEPDAYKAIKYGNSTNAREKCSNEEQFSWKYLQDYKKIMFLIKVANDYCYAAFERCIGASE